MKIIKHSTCIISALSSLFLLPSCTQTVQPSTQIPFDMANAQKHFISLKDASMLTSNFRQGKVALSRQLTDMTYLDKSFNLPNGELFNRDAIAALLNQKDAKGVRIYLGKDKDGLVKLVLVATDANGNDITGQPAHKIEKKTMMAEAPADTSGSTAILLEAGQRCPTMCATASLLN
jgi:hypothetical protein